ncbi:MAG TPA: M23 family metallopeptidase [Beijerinckiaceae bacterium]|nr:M23 family metallopeptidase [Beijerinckiaceae bacterium]
MSGTQVYIPDSTIDLGVEPPLALFNRSGEPPPKGRISARWLAGTVLTGFAGMGLMLAAAISAIEHRGAIVELPHMIKPREIASQLPGELVIAARKGDRLVQKADIVAARQTYKTPVVRKTAGGDVIRPASFTRISSPLAMETLGFANVIPAFNTARLIADASEDRALEAAQGMPLDSDVSLSTRTIEDGDRPALFLTSLSEVEVQAQVLEALSATRRTAPTLPAQMLLAKAMRAPEQTSSLPFAGTNDPFSRLVVRMVPENVTVAPRLEAALARNAQEQRLVGIRSEDNAEQVLRAAGLTPSQARDIVRSLTRGGQVLDTSKRLKLTLQALEPGAAKSVVRVDLYNEEIRAAAAGRKDDGSFVLIEATRPAAPSRRTTGEDDEGEGGFSLFSSLHETARKHGIPPPMIDEIVRVLFFDVDLQRAVGSNDSIEVLIGNDDSDTPGELMMLSLTFGGETRKFYRFALPDDDVVDYFDDQGRSAKKFLIRKPITDGELRSTFGSRRHPILGYWRQHNGVDWAAKIGTPILAAGNGTVRFAAWDSGYGRRVEIQHTNGYVTTYSHMSAFGRGIAEGVRVRQGQVIGYLGSSGLSTGPHLHYEVMIDERYVDPLAIRLPRGRELNGPQLADFRRQREQTDQVLKKAPGSAASLTAAGQASARP